MLQLSRRSPAGPALALLALAFAAASCGSSRKSGFSEETGGAANDPASSTFAANPQACDHRCAPDRRSVLDCNGQVVESCTDANACDQQGGKCVSACDAARSNHQSVGCEYYATAMQTFQNDGGYCFALIVANTWGSAAHFNVEYEGKQLPVEAFSRIPSGSGPGLSYAPYSATQGIPKGEVAVVFLAGPGGPKPQCPVAGAVPNATLATATGVGSSFRITSDVPVVAYQINPYGGGSAAVTGASLLLPTSVWDKNYIAVDAYKGGAGPSMNIVATEDNTTVTMVPVANVAGGGGVPAGAANAPMKITLQKGQHAQVGQAEELTGSVIEADKPIGMMAGHACMNVPLNVSYCDHAEQMIPPVRALGHEYVGVMYRPRKQEPAIWRVVGAVDGTQLNWSSNVGGPATLKRGDIAEFTTGEPFVVRSQDKDHPFMLFTYMSGSAWKSEMEGFGDADFVISVPPEQYMRNYVFFADPTYPEGNLVVVRAKQNGKFEDVELDCSGVLTGWTAVGDYEWTRKDLITGNFTPVGGCSSGRHEMKSNGPFGLWVWGWGTPQTSEFTENVSYGYPAGMDVAPVNTVVVPAVPR